MHIVQQGITDDITIDALRLALITRFGAVKDVEILTLKACAFAEFEKIEDARSAISASLSTDQGGNGYVNLEIDSDRIIRVSIESKRERGYDKTGAARTRGSISAKSKGNRGRITIGK